MSTTTSKKERVTWRDLMGPDEPEPEILTRPQFVERLEAEGITVSQRTLAYWESEGILPRAVRQWRDGAPQALYAVWLVDIVRAVRGMQDAGMTLEQIREAVRFTPWRTPMTAPGTPPATREDLASRWDAYTEASHTLGPQLAELARLRELATGARIVDVTITFRDAKGAIASHGFGAPVAWLGDEEVSEESTVNAVEYSTVKY